MKMAEEIISAMLSAQDTNPEDLIDDGSGTDSNEDVGEDSDDTTQCETSPDIKETTKKSHLLKNLKSALNLLSERALPEENGESNDERSESVSTSSGRPNWPPASIIEDFKSALVSCLPKESKMTATEIHSKLDDDHFPLSTTIKCLSILANEGVIIWENLIVSWPSTPEKEPAIPQMQIQDDLPEPGAQSVSEKVFQTSKKARKRPMAALEPRGKSERKKKTPLRLLDWNVHILFELINTCFSAYLSETCWKSFPQILTNCYCVTINIARLANAVQVTLWLSVTNPQNQFHHLSRIVNSVTKSLNH